MLFRELQLLFRFSSLLTLIDEILSSLTSLTFFVTVVCTTENTTTEIILPSQLNVMAMAVRKSCCSLTYLIEICLVCIVPHLIP